jgi:hypothetical protein
MPEHTEKSALMLRVNIPRLEVVGVVRRGHTKTSTKSEFIQCV